MSDLAPEAAPAVEAAPSEAAAPVDAPPVEPVLEGAPPIETQASVETQAPVVEPEDPFAAYGGKDTIEAAHRLYEATRSEDGVVDLFIEAGKSLGLSMKDLQALFGNGAPAPEGEQGPEFDPDEPLTIGQFQELQRKQAEEQAQREQARIRQVAESAVTSALKELDLDPASPTTRTILGLADPHVKGDYGNPEAVAAAVRTGYAEFQAQVQKEHERYLATKAQQAQQVPQAPAGGAPPSEAPEPEPKDVAEAIKRTRRSLGIPR